MFHVIIGDSIVEFDKFDDAIAFIREHMAAWNNFADHTEFRVSVTKWEDKEAHKIHVIETIDVQDIFGGGSRSHNGDGQDTDEEEVV